MKTSHLLMTIMTVAFLTLAGCGSSGGGGTPTAAGDDSSGSGTGGGSGATQTTINDQSGQKLLTRLDDAIPGCHYAQRSTTAVRQSSTLPSTIKKIHLPDTFDTITLDTNTQLQEFPCTDSDGNANGQIVMTTYPDQSAIDINFESCHMQTTTIDGALEITLVQDELTNEITAASASTPATGVRIINQDPASPEDVTLVLTDVAITGLNGLSLDQASLSTALNASASAATTGSQTITLKHLGLTDNNDNTQSVAFDNCNVTATENGDTNTVKITQCTITDNDGTYDVSSTDIVQNVNSDQTTGVVTVRASDGSTMTFTFDESTGEVLVAVNGETPQSLDCREAYTDAQNTDIGSLTQ